MKTIGLIGGMSWESTVPYYREINERRGFAFRPHRAGRARPRRTSRVIARPSRFSASDLRRHRRPLRPDETSGTELPTSGRTRAASSAASAGAAVEAAGAAVGLVLCMNTMHKVTTLAIEVAVSIHAPST